MAANHAWNEIKLWQMPDAPEPFRCLFADSSEWLALIPPQLASEDIEALFLRWHTETHPVMRRTLPDGTVLLAGSLPLAPILTAAIASQEDHSSLDHPRE